MIIETLDIASTIHLALLFVHLYIIWNLHLISESIERIEHMLFVERMERVKNNNEYLMKDSKEENKT